MPKALQYQKVLLIYEPNESCKDFIKFDRNALSTTETKKVLHEQRQMSQVDKLLQNA